MQLQRLGILDDNLAITPEAYTGHVVRKPVNVQAACMGIPLIILPPLSKEGRPERKAAIFLKSMPETQVEGGGSGEESYLLRSFLTCLADEFDARRRSHRITHEQIRQIEQRISTYDDIDVLRQLEKRSALGQHYSNGYGIEWPDTYELSGNSVTTQDIRRRFEHATPKRIGPFAFGTENDAKKSMEKHLASAKAAARHASEMYKYILVWRSFQGEQWGHIASEVIRNWDRMHTGWPDINVVHPTGGISVVEVKGTDRIHPSQVFTLLKLRELLGSNRVAIAWVNRIYWDHHIGSDHHDAARDWITSKTPSQPVNLRLPAHVYRSEANDNASIFSKFQSAERPQP